MAPPPDRPTDAQKVACPCGHGDVPAEIAGQRPLLERAAAGDREAFAHIHDDQVGGVHRYLLAWTGDPARAAELTAQVFHSAPRWLPITAPDREEAGAWLIAMARDAVQDPTATRPPPAGPPGNAVEALARLPAPQREILVLRLLCGHSLAHSAHLSGYPRRTVLELQLAACLAIGDLLGTPPAVVATPLAEEFERRLDHDDPQPSDDPPALAGALAVARSLRQAIPGAPAAPLPHPAPGPPLTHPAVGPRVTDPAPGPPLIHLDPGTRLTRPGPGRVPRWGSVADRRNWRDRLSTGWRDAGTDRRPWVATGVAVVGIVVVLVLQAFGDHGPPPRCGVRPCPAPTTAVVAAAGAASSLGTAPTTVAEPSTTGSTRASPLAPPSAPRTSTPATPPTTRPATTAAQTSGAPTTTSAPTTTAPPTTAPPTTTTTAPVTT
jgi:DNA-directed RNA polymerase specialized sigma24 family protein